MMTKRHLLCAPAVLFSLALAAPVAAQADPQAVVNDIIACSAISTVAARVACYDAVAAGARTGAAPVAAAGPGVAPRAPVQASGPAIAQANAPDPRDQFGRETMERPEDRPQPPAVAEITAAVTGTREVRPRYFAIALADGTEWEFTEAAAASYFPPRAGTSVTVQRGALGSFQLVVRGRAPVRVRRIR